METIALCHDVMYEKTTWQIGLRNLVTSDEVLFGNTSANLKQKRMIMALGVRENKYTFGTVVIYAPINLRPAGERTVGGGGRRGGRRGA